jgi:FkbM family methyltransferase
MCLLFFLIYRDSTCQPSDHNNGGYLIVNYIYHMYKMTSYSQLNQDLWVADVLSGKRNGVFVDVGAFDGINLSNTYLFEKDYDWTGICIEANISTFNRLQTNRKCPCVNELLSDVSGKDVSFQHLGELSFSGDNIYKYDIESISASNTNLDTQVCILKTSTLNDVLDKNNIPKLIDYLSIDVEGMEFDILKTFDFMKYHINVITVEHNAAHIGMEYRSQLFELLTTNGFKFIKGNDNVQNWNNDKYYIEDFYINRIIKH